MTNRLLPCGILRVALWYHQKTTVQYVFVLSATRMYVSTLHIRLYRHVEGLMLENKPNPLFITALSDFNDPTQFALLLSLYFIGHGSASFTAVLLLLTGTYRELQTLFGNTSTTGLHRILHCATRT